MKLKGHLKSKFLAICTFEIMFMEKNTNFIFFGFSSCDKSRLRLCLAIASFAP